MRTIAPLALATLIATPLLHAADIKPQVVGNPDSASTPTAATGQIVVPAGANATAAGTPKAYTAPKAKSSSGNSGAAAAVTSVINALTATPAAGKSGATPAATSSAMTPSSLPSGGACGPGLTSGSCWQAACSVSGEGIIPEGAGYDLGSAAWPKLNDGGKEVVFPGRKSMCTSATATAFLKHISDLVNAGKLTLTPAQIGFLNGPTVHELLNGNTYSFALLNQYLGGQNVAATTPEQIRAKLAEAQAGDVLKFDRTSGTGHSTIFKEVRGDQFCYWSSQTSQTNGVGERCEPISKLKGLAISRLPDASVLAQKIDEAMNSSELRQKLRRTDNGSIPLSAVNWNSHLTCDSTNPGSTGAGGSQGTTK